MRITEVNLPRNEALGLYAVTMRGLGTTVVLAGRNGAGKSRLLQQLAKWPERFQKEAVTATNVTRFQQQVDQKRISPIEAGQKRLAEQKELLEHRHQLVLSEDEKPIMVPFVPTGLTLMDPQQLTHQSMLQQAKSTESPGVDNLHHGAFALVQTLQDRYREATHQERMIDDAVAVAAISEYKRMQDVIRQFLGTEITRSVDQQAQLFGLPLGKSALSAGQKVILQLCVAIHAQGARLNNLVIVLDEPENHLHPAALLDLVAALQERLGNGQMWIATHSLPLLAHVDPSTIWWMDENGISKAGNTPDKVLSGLLGDSERRDRLADFLDLPFELASNRFVVECLRPPGTVAHREGDPQTDQVRSLIESRMRDGLSTRILDFGAGRGRLACELRENWPPEVLSKIDYIAFDPSPKDRDACRGAIEALHGSSDNRIFSDPTAFRACYDEESVDIVIMCNVLHEISCERWGDFFGAEGWFPRLLTSTGVLIIAEVQQLPYGEHANPGGFLVLDTAQVRRLFAVREEDRASFAVTEKSDGWLKAHLVGRELIRRYTPETLDAALRDLSLTARDRIRSLREAGTGYRQGRQHGFWVQQFANAELSIRR